MAIKDKQLPDSVDHWVKHNLPPVHRLAHWFVAEVGQADRRLLYGLIGLAAVTLIGSFLF